MHNAWPRCASCFCWQVTLRFLVFGWAASWRVSLGGFVSPLMLKIVIVGWQLVVSEIVLVIQRFYRYDMLICFQYSFGQAIASSPGRTTELYSNCVGELLFTARRKITNYELKCLHGSHTLSTACTVHRIHYR